MSAVLSSDMDHTDKVVGFVRECQEMGLVIEYPNIQNSRYYFSVDDQKRIIYGLGAIKGVGQAAIESILESRKDSPFTDFYDFCHRIDLRKVNKRVLEALIAAGACDCLGETRATLQVSTPKVLKLVEQHHKNSQSGQGDLFGSGSSEAVTAADWKKPDVLPWTDRVRLSAEKDTLGLYLSGHPLNTYQQELKDIVTDSLQDVLDQKNKKESVIIAGYLISKRLITTKRGQQMAILTLEDQTAQIDVTLFQDVYHSVIEMLDQPSVWLVDGRARTDTYNGRQQVVADRMQQLDVWRMVKAKQVRVLWDATTQEGDSLDVLLSGILGPFRGGDCRVCVMYRGVEETAEMELGVDWSVDLKPPLLEHLQQVFGTEKVAVHY